MAEYIETVYALTPAPTTETYQEYSFVAAEGGIQGDYYSPKSWNSAIMEFPPWAESPYSRKALVSQEIYGHITARSGTYSGALYAGSFVFVVPIGKDPPGLGRIGIPEISLDNANYKALSSYQINAYGLLQKYTWRYQTDSPAGPDKSEIHPSVGVTPGAIYYTGRLHTARASITISGAQTSTPPYMIRRFADAVPRIYYSTMRTSPETHFDEKRDTTFFFKVSLYNPGSLRVMPKMKSFNIRWRAVGGGTIYTAYSQSGAGKDFAGETFSHTIGPGTLSSQDIQWQVQVITDDNVSSDTESTDWKTLKNIKNIPIQLTNLSPQSGFVNEKVVNTFFWGIDYVYTYDNDGNPIGGLVGTPLVQASASFQWRPLGYTDIRTIPISGSSTQVTIPANTFSDSQIEWRVSSTSDRGQTTGYSEWFLLTTVDERPNKPTGLYPNTGTRDGTQPISFSWLHNSPLSTPQSGFELQITYDGGNTWKALSNKVVTETTQFTAAANTILPTDASGRVGWRVRTYNSDGVSSSWSDTAFFIVHPAPQRPNWISVESGRARPLCRWTSIGQVGYQVQVVSGEAVLFDSGETYGTETEYRIPDYLPNGVFTFRVRIKNIRALWSDWANIPVTVNARRSLSIVLNGVPVENGAQLTFDVEVRVGG